MSARDIVYLRGLPLHSVIGVHDWERNVRQELVLDLEVAGDNRAAAATDTLADAIDYQTLAEALQAHAVKCSFQLLESLAEDLADLLINELGQTWVRLRLAKPGALPGSTEVGVSIEREVGPS